MRVCVLSSGSKGNCSYIETNSHKILIDIGNSCAYVERSLRKINVDPDSIDIILITHAHVDHIAGLRVFVKKHKVKVFMTQAILKESKLNIDFLKMDKCIKMDSMVISAIKTSHDVDDSLGYIIEDGLLSVVYITDTGYINERYYKQLRNKNVYIFESNHDPELLMNNDNYPYHTKIRILGDKGHLSNADSAYYLSEFIGSNTKKVYLAHLSEQNNTDLLALSSLQKRLKSKGINFANIEIAHQNEISEVFQI